MKLRELVQHYYCKNSRFIDLHYYEDRDTVQPIVTLTAEELDSNVYLWNVVFNEQRETNILVVVI